MKNFSIEIKWALRFTLLVLAWAIGEKAIGLHDEYIENYGMYSLLFAFPAFMFYYLAIIEKKKYFYNNSITFRQGFISTIVLSAMIALVNPAAQYVIYKSVTPHFFDNMIAYKISSKNYPMTMENAKLLFNLNIYMLESTFTGLSKGLIAGAIISMMIRNKK